LQTQQQLAVLVGVQLPNQTDFLYSMNELAKLAHACNIEVVGEITQKREQIQASHYIGRGKVGETQRLIDESQANLVIFNDELSPTQIRNLEADIDCKVIDRTVLILDIFTQRARTKEAQLQVEIAQLQYMLPRLVGLRKSLGRQSGGVGTRNKGLGEKKLELDRRNIEAQITQLEKELKTLVKQRQTQRKQRKKRGIPVVALVGYTNAGKSTLMNALVSHSLQKPAKPVLEKDMLFATLETTVRNIQLSKHKSFLLTDTVGFIHKLPHHLVKAFRSTLEEVKEADVLIHVVDYSHPEYMQMIDVTNQVLADIGVKNIPIIYAYNKADQCHLQLPIVTNQAITLSAKQQIGITELIDMVSKEVFRNYRSYQLEIPYVLLPQLQRDVEILSTTYLDEHVDVIVEAQPTDIQRYNDYLLHATTPHL
jgi:GTP-binding protein HflX